jgi:hypothetical protein
VYIIYEAGGKPRGAKVRIFGGCQVKAKPVASAWRETLPQDTGEIKIRNFSYFQHLKQVVRVMRGTHLRSYFNLPIYRAPPDIKQSLSGGYLIYVVRIYTE